MKHGCGRQSSGKSASQTHNEAPAHARLRSERRLTLRHGNRTHRRVPRNRAGGPGEVSWLHKHRAVFPRDPSHASPGERCGVCGDPRPGRVTSARINAPGTLRVRTHGAAEAHTRRRQLGRATTSLHGVQTWTVGRCHPLTGTAPWTGRDTGSQGPGKACAGPLGAGSPKTCTRSHPLTPGGHPHTPGFSRVRDYRSDDVRKQDPEPRARGGAEERVPLSRRGTHLGHAAHVLHGGPLVRELGESPLDLGDDRVYVHGVPGTAAREVERRDAFAAGGWQGLLLLCLNLRQSRRQAREDRETCVASANATSGASGSNEVHRAPQTRRAQTTAHAPCGSHNTPDPTCTQHRTQSLRVTQRDRERQSSPRSRLHPCVAGGSSGPQDGNR